ncbi:VOC family protein [Aeromicrobium sp. UC242_57]|uniref:VOC family protein n=1 Tax=Aeromicrobium sp. UC242_57 TaxID=3374624 RepID=UPI0037B0B9E1
MTEQAPASRHHSIDYIEIAVRDVAVAKEFYASAFGWEFNDYGPGYAGIKDPAAAGREVGGLCLGEDVRPGGPLVIVFSDDLEASVQSVVDAGGEVINGPVPVPGWPTFPFHRSERQRACRLV